MKQGYVYFIRPCGLDGPIKIGWSQSPGLRLEGLAAWSPFPLEIIGSVPGTMADENYLHRCFWALVSHREWFRSSPELRATIDRILALGGVPRDIADPASLGTGRMRRWTEDHSRALSYHQKCSRVARIAPRPDGGYWTIPSNVTRILREWGTGRDGVRHSPSAAEIAELDAFLADPQPRLVFVRFNRGEAA